MNELESTTKTGSGRLPDAACSAEWFYNGWSRKVLKTEQGATTIIEIMSLRADEIVVWKRARARRGAAALRNRPNDTKFSNRPTSEKP